MTRRILLVISSLGAGGAERVAATMANYWDDAGHRIGLLTYATRVQDHYELHPQVERIGLDLLWDSHGMWDRLTSFYKRTLRLRRAILGFSPDVVVSFIEQTNVRVLLALIGAGIPVIVSERIDPRHHVVEACWQWLRQWFYPAADIVVVQTEAVLRWVAAFVPRRKIRVIPNAVPPLNPATDPPPMLVNGRTVLAAGRLTHQKGFDLLIDAFAASSGAQKGWRLVILGEGPERAVLEQQAQRLGLEDHVFLPGVVSPIEAWLSHADLFVLSSRYEGFPNVLVEAMACGLPVVAFDCESGPAEIVQTEADGLLVPPEDTVALSSAMGRLMEEPEQRRRFGAAAKKNIERLALPRVMHSWECAIESAIARRKRR
jgi:GalNAc-alpha-(1->4)-GalNAc-alpha-(1->3)-diNAcBac-PP-undecaprenol alpha-1,4-N-acetyl-D-galactosaminyltransferase